VIQWTKLARALRCAEVDTPFILITAYGDAHVRREARALGAAAVIDKPFGFGELQHALRRALAHVEVERERRGSQRRMPPPMSERH